MKQKYPISIIFIFVVSLSFGQILTFEFNGNQGNEATATSNFNDATLTNSTISRGSGLNATNAQNSFSSSGWNTVSIDDAVANNDYIEFTITPVAGAFFNVTNITFKINRNNNGLTSIALRNSLDGYATNIDAIVPITANNQVVTFTVNQVNSTTAVTYRLYGTSVTAGGQGRLRAGGANNDIIVEGAVSTTTPVSCNISDDFTESSIDDQWTVFGSNSSVVNNELSIGTGGVAGYDYIYQDASTAYNTTIGTLTDPITWEFNMQGNAGNPSGFNNNANGMAFVLGNTNSDMLEGNGYAVVLGTPGNQSIPDYVRLVHFTDGIDGNNSLVDIIVDTVDYAREHLSIRVVFDPGTSTWELYVRNDGNQFASPTTLDATNLVGTVVDSTYTGLSLDYIAALWRHNNNVNLIANFDNICISAVTTCLATTTWDGTNWIPGIPDINTAAVIDGNYTTSSAGAGSFTACSLTINSGFTLTIDDGDFVDIDKFVLVNDGARITTETQGSFVQRNDGALAGDFILVGSGAADVIKTTAVLANWYNYTYWSSPVENETTDVALSDADPSRRFWYDANNYLDANSDSIDDDGNDWALASGSFAMTPGQGFAATHNAAGFLGPRGYDYTFTGAYNTGDVTYPVFYDSTNPLHWNLIGNPYPSALDIDDFFAENGTVIVEALYMWSQVSPPDGANPGNEVLNFSQNDYVTVNAVGEAGNGTIPDSAVERYVPSGQSFFIPSRASDDVLFTNSMRIAANNANDIFYRNTSQSRANTTSEIEKLWLNLSSDIGIYSQISVAYADIATNGDDGHAIDTPRNYAGTAGVLYSLDNDGVGFYVIQGKALSSLDTDETIKVGFATFISTTETYTLSLVGSEGNFLTSNPIYLRDNHTGIIHDLSTAYTFVSDPGIFEDRFEIVFNNSTLSVDETTIDNRTLSIVELTDDNIRFSINGSPQTIKTVSIFDMQGRLVDDFKGDSSSEVYNLSTLSTSIFIAKVELSNGQVLTQKAFKK